MGKPLTGSVLGTAGSALTAELTNMLGLPALKTAWDKYLYKAVVITNSRPDPQAIGRSPNILDVAFCWATSVREAVAKMEMAYGKTGLKGPFLVEVVNCEPTNIIYSQLMDRDLTEEEMALAAGGGMGVGGPGLGGN